MDLPKRSKKHQSAKSMTMYVFCWAFFCPVYWINLGVSYILVTDACFEIQFSSKDPNWAEVVAAVDEVKQIFQLKAAKHENLTKLNYFS